MLHYPFLKIGDTAILETSMGVSKNKRSITTPSSCTPRHLAHRSVTLIHLQTCS